jgi:hypothetical protein
MQTMTQVRERPILFSAPMVRAILYGTKTQTRRVVIRRMKDEGEWVKVRPVRGYTPETIRSEYPCPYGQPGDRLWVREACGIRADLGRQAGVVYRADHPGEALPFGHIYDEATRWRPSIHMPRWASRITLEITDVRVERAQEITEADAIAEGINPRTALAMNGMSYFPNLQAWALTDNGIPGAGEPEHGHRGVFAQLWDSLNAPRGYGWEANPWVWVVSFRRINP